MWPVSSLLGKTKDLLLRHPTPSIPATAAAVSESPANAQSSSIAGIPRLELLSHPASSLKRSIVTHAVLGSEAAGVNALPPELLLLIFSKLDAQSLTQLAAVSRSSLRFTEDETVWHRCTGHSKSAERAKHLRLAKLRQEQLEAEERWRRQRWRRVKRRALAVLQAVCGFALVFLFFYRGKETNASGAPDSSGRSMRVVVPAAGKLLEQAAPRGESVSEAIGDIVWAAASCSTVARPGSRA